MNRLMVIGILVTLLLSSLAPLAYAVPTQATDVEITPKISVKGPKGQGKPLKQAATGVLGVPPPGSGRRWAIVIGISDYAGTGSDIQYADDDALDMLNALVNVYGYPRSHILLLISDYKVNNATRSNIMNAVSWLKRNAKNGDEVVFFYSGHGARGKADDGDRELVDEAIVPYECTAESLIWDGELASMFSGLPSSRIIFIFDSCYAGGMNDLKAEGRIVVMACSESGLSYEFSTVENGQFTYYLVDQGILLGKADAYNHDNDSVLGEPSDVVVEEAFDYAKAYCVYQTPTISDSFPNDLLL
ncbi:MAG: caspase family protein [Thermoproteota archaeon]